MATIFSKTFWKDASERAIKSGAQAIGIALTGGAANILTLDWQIAGGAVLTGIVLSYATSIVSAGIGDRGTASLVPAGR